MKIAIKERYFIKVVPQRGETVHRFEVTRRHIIGAAMVLAVLVAGSLGFGALQIVRAHAQVAQLQTLTSKQGDQLRTIDHQTTSIRSQLQKVQKQNQEIRQLIGAKPTKTSDRRTRGRRVAMHGNRPLVSLVARHVEMLSAASAQTVEESNVLRRLTMHVLNIRHLQSLTRARLIASIPSIDPVEGAPIVGCFCYRTSPDVEFHPGVDLAANYGDTVHAAAAGTVVSAGWDGGYGKKVDIDHGNGYHTWYAHLSQIDVHVGQSVYKNQSIALVGSTGFSTGPHLHYQVMLDGKAVDPAPYLNGVPSKVLASLP
ncbi:MAG TPA: M23 family metallopeptidase [Candidatus Baltobacteraceae bacterium]|jgi:murein DD-endopeptidase MepM/ murein hydrolase activator NlpD